MMQHNKNSPRQDSTAVTSSPQVSTGVQPARISSRGPTLPETIATPVTLTPSTPSFKLFSNALRESFDETLTQIKSLSNVGRFLCVAVSLPLMGGLCYLSVSQALGALAGVFVVQALGFRDNHQIRAQQAVGQTLFAIHLALLGAWPAVLQSSLTAMRCTFLGMRPDETRQARVAAAIVGFGVATAIFSSCFEVFPLVKLSNMPIAVMALASAAEAFPKKYSWATRLCYLTTAGALIPYHLLASGSWMGIGINTFAVATLVRSIYKNDLVHR
jgi:hypothetical protein